MQDAGATPQQASITQQRPCHVSQGQRTNLGTYIAKFDCSAAVLLQVMLPQSVGQQLEQQGAAVNGAPFFQLRAPSGAATHAGALVYEAAEGTVALPLKVIRRCGTAAPCYFRAFEG